MNTIQKQVAALPTIRTIAIIGLSDNPHRYSYEVAAYLQKRGIRIIPVNPMITQALGEKAYSSLLAIPRDIAIDVVLIYRRVAEVPVHIEEVIQRGDISVIWLPEGVEHAQAQEYATTNGISVISNFCIMKEHRKSTGAV